MLVPILLLLWIPASIAQCTRSSDHYISGLCYTFVNKLFTHRDATNYCHYNNPSGQSTLAIIQSSIQNNFLASLIVSNTNIANTGHFWIGLSRYSYSDRFLWENGTPLTWYNFEAGFPGAQNYVIENVSNGKWRTVDEESEYYFVCSYDPAVGGTTSLPTVGPTEQQATTDTYYSTDFSTQNSYTTTFESTTSEYWNGRENQILKVLKYSL